MSDVLMCNPANVARSSPSASAAFTPADVENGVKRETIVSYG
ncbi:hypothetical protein AWB69_01322 [Caballeronia udeis]|uniref:Uncharacterized protein n=1 Tax=Caballeronia udeis TaxID=1232866 RepID=A0A158FL03_9BURK|nr:hypothetical protein AWB69_01322 [Caballeronia udeis]